MFRAQLRPNLFLAILEERHAEEFFAVVDSNRAYLSEWLPWVELSIGSEQTLAFIKASLQQFAANEGFAAGLWYDGRPAGCIGFHKIDWSNRKVELGYWLAASYWGQGLMTDACRAMVSHAFEELKLNRVQIQCAVDNVKSCAIPQRLGFRHEGVARQSQYLRKRYFDLNFYGMIASDWNQ